MTSSIIRMAKAHTEKIKILFPFPLHVRCIFSFLTDNFDSLPRTFDGRDVWMSRQEHSKDDPRFIVLSEGAKLLFPLDADEGPFPQASAWNEKFVVPNQFGSKRLTLEESTALPIWIDPDIADKDRPADRFVHGNYVTFISWFTGNYGHFLHDHLPIIAWLREYLDPEVKFILLYHPRHEEILNTVDPTFVRERVEWIQRQELVQINDGTLTVMAAATTPYRNLRLIESLGRWLNDARPATHDTGKGTIIYYTRGGSSDTMHGRVVEPNHEADIIAAIRAKMAKYNRPEELVIYNGQENGATMAIERQFELFRSASTVIGPHGSGLANVVWMDASSTPTTKESADRTPSTTCAKRPRILEFLLGPDSTQVQPTCPNCKGNPFSRTYYHLFSTIPWVEYNHLLYAGNSTEATTYIDLTALDLALEDMWSNINMDEENSVVQTTTSTTVTAPIASK